MKAVEPLSVELAAQAPE